MTPRHRAREAALQILYRMELGGGRPLPRQAAELARELGEHFDHFGVPEASRGYAALLVTGTLSALAELDAALESHALHWKVDRMATVDRCILRLAAYELRGGDVPASVVIDEAIELAKKFGTSDTPGFVNGVLDAIRRSRLPGAPRQAKAAE